MSVEDLSEALGSAILQALREAGGNLGQATLSLRVEVLLRQANQAAPRPADLNPALACLDDAGLIRFRPGMGWELVGAGQQVCHG